MSDMITLKRALRVFTMPDRYREAAYRREVRAVKQLRASQDAEGLSYLSDCAGWEQRMPAICDRAAQMWEDYLSYLGGVSGTRDGAWIVDGYENVYFQCAEPDGGSYTECETGWQETFSFDCQANALLWELFLRLGQPDREVHTSVYYKGDS
jgi:hypothetical protein